VRDVPDEYPRRSLPRLPVRDIVATAAVSACALIVATQTDETGPVLAFSGAIVVAVITWVSSDRRQDRALVAERERQSAQLTHDRELADLADLRELLDEAARAFQRATEAGPSRSWLAETEGSDVWATFSGTVDKLMSSDGELDALIVRLSVRLGREHVITASLVAAGRALREMASGLAWFTPGDPAYESDSSTERERIVEAGIALFGYRREFEAAVVRFAGSRLRA
jgi:hypothetical protein